MRYLIVVAWWAVLGVLISALVARASSKVEAGVEIQAKAELAFSSWKCAAMAGKLRAHERAVRHIAIGYGNGRVVLSAVPPDLNPWEQYQWMAPLSHHWRHFFDGPSIDFTLGRIFEMAVNEIDWEMRRVLPAHKLSDDHADYLAKEEAYLADEYRKANCRLL